MFLNEKNALLQTQLNMGRRWGKEGKKHDKKYKEETKGIGNEMDENKKKDQRKWKYDY